MNSQLMCGVCGLFAMFVQSRRRTQQVKQRPRRTRYFAMLENAVYDEANVTQYIVKETVKLVITFIFLAV